MLLSNATRGKLDPRWTDPWVVLECNGPTTLQIQKDGKEQVVHVSRVRPFLEEDMNPLPLST